MSCARYEQWLHLHRPGELSKEDQVLLERHLAECSRCAALSTRVAAAERALARLRDPLPENPDAEAAAERVLLAVSAAKSPPRRSITAGVLDSIVSMFDQPRLRYATAVLLGLLGGTLVFQQVSVLQNVSSLEQRMADTQDRRGRMQMAFLVRSEAVSRLPDSRRLIEALGDRVTLDQNENILITREQAVSLQEDLARALLFDPRVQEVVSRNRTVIDETIRALRLQANTVFRVSRKGGA